MHSMKSLKIIAEMTGQERYDMAQIKMEGIVNALINHIKLHINNEFIVYSPILSSQIGTSYAANAFNHLQSNSIHYEIIRLCTFWDDVDLDKQSIPTVIELVNNRDVTDIVYKSHYNQYENFNQNWAHDWGNKARRRLRTGVRDSQRVANSDLLLSVRNFRDKLAHQLEKTREEKRGPVPVPRYGDEKRLLGKTITAVNRLFITLNNTSIDWKENKDLARKNAEALWKGCNINVLR